MSGVTELNFDVPKKPHAVVGCKYRVLKKLPDVKKGTIVEVVHAGRDKTTFRCDRGQYSMLPDDFMNVVEVAK